MNKISTIKGEATKLTTQILKLGTIATIARFANNTYNIQVNSAIEHTAFDFRRITEEAKKQ